ncbi:MAG: DUF5071 domain-containing protein [Bacteroidota bacterium]
MLATLRFEFPATAKYHGERRPSLLEPGPTELPRITSKMDENAARRLVALGYPTVAPALPHLLEWIQDMNWPVARIVAPFLASVGLPLVPALRRVFETDDGVWKYWCLELLQDMDRAVLAELRPEIERMATRPSATERYEEVDLVAMEVLQRVGHQG